MDLNLMSKVGTNTSMGIFMLMLCLPLAHYTKSSNEESFLKQHKINAPLLTNYWTRIEFLFSI